MADLTPDEFRRRAYAVVDWIADYRAGLPDLPVAPDVEPGSVRAAMSALWTSTGLPEEPEALAALLDGIDRVVVPGSTHWQHPGFFGYFPANASLHSLLGELLSGGLGAQGMLWATSPAATEVEQTLLDALAGALGLHRDFTFEGGGGGSIQDSASSAALVALLAALHRANPAWRADGVDGRDRVYVTAETHSSLAKAARVAGLGARALRTVAFRPGTRSMDPAALSAMIAADRAAGLRPALVCPTIGTTGTGAVDPVREVVAVASGAWVHVDAAWAGVAALCPEHRHLLDGVEGADSFCTDAHKWLATAFDASLLWVRDGRALPDALSITPEYLRNTASESGAVVDYRDWQVPLGRRFRALKLWSVLSGYGLSGLRAHLRGHIALADELAHWVEEEPGFILVVPPSLGLVCLRLESDERTTGAMAQVNASGRALLTHTVVDGRTVIRVAIGGVTTGREHVVALWEELRKAASAL
ncbi:MAG: aspartate aminotransferase family protein [Pseudonocardiales bacterium]|nr:aspartate aminotransferase family protein [Pseudonocardiales bacterium]